MNELENVKQRAYKFIEAKGLSVAEFERRCGLSNGYVKGMRKNFGDEKLVDVLRAFPELNRDWLLYGEGDMIRSSGDNVINSIGDNNRNTVNRHDTTDKFIGLLQKKDEQIDRLLSIIETISNK
ncbi:MAG: hypothetical protein LUD50_03180 [Clostridia bacterium]|nr:hypothetical protein [Clostridia bacterium]